MYWAGYIINNIQKLDTLKIILQKFVILLYALGWNSANYSKYKG